MRIILSTRIGECNNNHGTKIPNNRKKRKRKDNNDGSEQEAEPMSKWREVQPKNKPKKNPCSEHCERNW